jgi:hypothetical protein
LPRYMTASPTVKILTKMPTMMIKPALLPRPIKRLYPAL